MASIRQSIPNYSGGISQQPDHLKKPGQVKECVNAIPDLIQGLYKRPGSKRIGTSKLANVQSGGSYFHYHRDGEEGSYIGQIAADGTPRIWKAEGDNPGAAQTIAYGTGGETAIKTYLSSTDPENLQYLTINDTTFVTNRDTDVTTTGTTDTRPDTHYAYIDLLKAENGRQYGLNIYSNNTPGVIIKRATRIKITDDDLNEGDGTGHCPSIGTEVFSVSADSSYATRTGVSWVKDPGGSTVTSGKDNLIFRVTITGQQGNSNQDDDAPDAAGFRCTYNRRIELLHGGEGWEDGDSCRVFIDNNQTTCNVTVTVTEVEYNTVKADIKAVRPTPTPFDTDTAVTADTVLGGIVNALTGTGITSTVIGTGLYLTKAASFSVEVVDKDLMRVMQETVNDVGELPIQCKHGYIVKVSNARQSEEDDYYVRFYGDNDRDGTGSWQECPAPGVVKGFDASKMPHVIQRTSIANQGQANELATFTVKQFVYAERDVGDDDTNPQPSFVGNPINQVLFFRNRIVFLSKQNLIASKPGTADKPDFWRESALTVGTNDRIDIASSSTLPSDLFNGIESNTGLICLSSNHQFLFTSDDTILNPDTAKMKTMSVYNCNTSVPPVSLGVTVGFLDNSGKYTRFNEILDVKREGEPTIIETSKIVNTLLEKDIDLITNSRENGIVLLGKTDSDTVVGYKYLTVGNERQQSSWFKWKFNNPIKFHFIVNDTYYYLDTDDFLQSINLLQADTDLSIDEGGVNYLIHLDNYTTVSGGVYDATTKLTTFTNQATWIPDVTTPNGKLVVIDTDAAATRVGRYAECTLTGNSPNDDFTVPGDWSSATVNIGYLYDYQVDFPTVYVTKQQGKNFTTDINSSLILHRIKLGFGKVGLYETTLNRIHKLPYTEVYESSALNQYNVSDAPYLDEDIKTIPVYEKNKNVDITLKSTHPAPATLLSMSWEGDYSPKYYKRV